MNDVHVTVCGNLVAAPERRATAGGQLRASFRLATTPRRFDRSRGEWVDGEPSYYTVIAWRGLADGVVGSLGKGDPVVVHGRLVLREWVSEDQQRRGTAHEIEADAVGPDLRRCTARVHRAGRALDAHAAPGAGWAGEPAAAGPFATDFAVAPSEPPAA